MKHIITSSTKHQLSVSFMISIGNRLSFKNMALNKLAESSSVYNGDFHAHSPLKMTDGERTDKNLHCAATKMETQPWFRVDLQNVHQVDHVVVYTGKE